MSELTAGDVANALETELAPLRFQQDIDCSGFTIGDRSSVVTGVICALDVTSDLIDEAARVGANFIWTHHPILFQRKLSAYVNDASDRAARTVFRATAAGLVMYASHTNFDVCNSSHAQLLADMLGMANRGPFLAPAHAPAAHAPPTPGPVDAGAGVVGDLPAPVTLRELALQVQRLVPSPGFRVAATPDMLQRSVQRIAVFPGASAFTWKTCLKHKVDAFVTGDVTHHTARDSVDAGIPMIDCTHFAGEVLCLEIVINFLKRKFPTLKVIRSEQQDIFCKF